jgi:hypothetical protein
MDELVAKVVADTGVDAAVARKAVLIILRFLLREGPADKMGKLVDALPGTREAMEASEAGGTAGLMGVFNDLTAAGLGMSQIQAVAHSFGAFAREKADAETVNQIVASVPGLSQFV